MKKILLFTAILFASITMVTGQNQKIKYDVTPIPHNSVNQGEHLTATTELRIVLNPILSISVNTSNISLVYTTVEDYKTGVRSGFIQNHLEVNSTGGYNVGVSYAYPYDSYNDKDNDIKYTADKMFESIQVVPQKTDGVNGRVFSKYLRVNPKTIIISNKGEFGAKFNVDYRGSADYMNSIKEGERRVYAAYVTYTITSN